MKFPQPLLKGTLIKRYKRFLADIKLDNGKYIIAHCPNSGSMMGCKTPGSLVYVSKNSNKKRKLKYTWELISINNNWVGINTNHPNKLVKEAIENSKIPELTGYDNIRTEVKFGCSSRLDLLLEGPQGLCYVEIKNVTLVENRTALFPDAVTERGQKHLRELMNVVAQKHRSVIFFVVQREDTDSFSCADNIDPTYGKLFREAIQKGVQPLVYQTHTSPQEIYFKKPLSIVLKKYRIY
jgi:sugar fermentation stimulation protein A